MFLHDTLAASADWAATGALAGSGSEADRELIRHQVEKAIECFPLPDQGIWETRGEPQHYVSSKVSMWVAADRGARMAHEAGVPEIAERWEAKADEFKAEILEKGCRDGVFRQHYETDALDASLLLLPLYRFLPNDRRNLRAGGRLQALGFKDSPAGGDSRNWNGADWTVQGHMKRRATGTIDGVVGRYSDMFRRTPDGWRIARVTFTRLQ